MLVGGQMLEKMYIKSGNSQHKLLLTTAVFELFFTSVDQLTSLYLTASPLAYNRQCRGLLIAIPGIYSTDPLGNIRH